MEMNDIRSLARTSTSPIQVVRTRRAHPVRVLTTMPAGKMVPIAAMPLLREDNATGRIRLTFEQRETAELLMNSVQINVKAYLVPTLASPRFKGMDDLNRAWEGVPREVGDDVIPFVETMEWKEHGTDEVHKYLGKHGKEGAELNAGYVEAYNLIWNLRARNRSGDIELRALDDTDLAPAFWQHSQFAHIVPNVDLAALDGEVPLNLINARLPVLGIGLEASRGTEAYESQSIKQSDGTTRTGRSSRTSAEGYLVRVAENPDNLGFPDVFAELAQNGITVSLSNIDLARKTQAFARLRRQYEGHSDEWIINMLMDGISIPDMAWQQPILLADQTTIVGMAKRFAADGDNLTKSVASGITEIDLAFATPKVPTGGIIMVVAELTPEQFFERQQDPFLHATAPSDFPHYLRDVLDPEKVEVVPNGYIDTDHSDPTGIFGYAPLNHKWAHWAPSIGGDFYRPEVDDTFDEDRQRIWAVETQDPTLSTDFFLCTNMHTKPFVVTNRDVAEVVGRGSCVITGNTVFGSKLLEANDSFQKVWESTDHTRIADTEAE